MLRADHQPNFLPRLPTLAKLYAADIWIILDDIQFNRRDYQHRCYLRRCPTPNSQTMADHPRSPAWRPDNPDQGRPARRARPDREARLRDLAAFAAPT